MSVLVRSASIDDASALAPLFDQLGYPTPVAEIRERLAALNAESEVLVAAEDGIVAFVALSLHGGFVGNRTCVIEGFVVRDTHRGRTIGTRLLDAAEKWAFDRGVRHVTVRSNVVRERARQFYERHGYEIVKTQSIFEKRLP